MRESKRAKRLSIKVFPRGRVEVVVPKRTRPGDVQAFIEANREWIERMKENPLARAVRLDKLQLAALEATLQLYLTGRENSEVPVRFLVLLPEKELKKRAEKLCGEINGMLKKE